MQVCIKNLYFSKISPCGLPNKLEQPDLLNFPLISCLDLSIFRLESIVFVITYILTFKLNLIDTFL